MKKILIATNSEPIYRHSFTADFYIYDIASKTLRRVSNSKVQEPTFSADNSKVAYVFNNNMYVYDVAAKSEKQITTDGFKNAVSRYRIIFAKYFGERLSLPYIII